MKVLKPEKWYTVRSIVIHMMAATGFFLYQYIFWIKWYRLESGIYLIGMTILLHFWVIDSKWSHDRKLIAVVGGIIGIEAILLRSGNRRTLASLCMFGVAVILLILTISYECNNKKSISSWALFQSGMGTFGVLMTLVYAMNFVGRYESFDLTCATLTSQTSNFIETISLQTSRKWLKKEQIVLLQTWWNLTDITIGEAVGNIKLQESLVHTWSDSYTISWFEVDNLLHTQSIPISITSRKNTANIQSLLPNIAPTNQTTIQTSQIPVSLENNIEVTHDSAGWNQRSGGILGQIEYYKGVLIDQVMSDKKLVDQWVCNYIVEQIQQRYSKPNFQISVVVLLFVLLLPFVKLIFWLVGIIGFVLFQLAKWCKIYTFEIDREPVEKIK